MKKLTLVEWSKIIRNRDEKCLHCGKTEGLHAHHIKPKSTHPELALDLSNGITLCYSCHKQEHERNRQQRIRSSTPQRRTMLKKIAQLEEEVSKSPTGKLLKQLSKLELIISVLDKRLSFFDPYYKDHWEYKKAIGEPYRRPFNFS